MKNNTKKRYVLNHMINNNDHDYNLLKASEEFQELSLILTQKINKPLKVSNEDIIKEIGDCKIRLKVLEKIYSKKSVKYRIKHKIDKFYEYIVSNKYKNI